MCAHTCQNIASGTRDGPSAGCGTYLFATPISGCAFSTCCGGCFVLSLLRPVLSSFGWSCCTAAGTTGFDSLASCSLVDVGACCCTVATIFAGRSVCWCANLPLFGCEAVLWLGAECFDFGLCFCESAPNNNNALLVKRMAIGFQIDIKWGEELAIIVTFSKPIHFVKVEWKFRCRTAWLERVRSTGKCNTRLKWNRFSLFPLHWASGRKSTAQPNKVLQPISD